MAENEKVLTCYHCGNQTLMKEVKNYIHKDSDLIRDEYGNPIHEVFFQQTWRLYFCPVCENVTLYCETFDSEEVEPNGNPVATIQQLYPYKSPLGDNNLPSNVANAFEAAIKVRKIDGAICAIATRRTLEMMCKDKGGEGNNLYLKLKSLSDKGILPPILNDMASVLREIGNDAAHADEQQFSDTLVQSMIDFTQTILDYVYNLPKQIEKIQNDIGKKSGDSVINEDVN